MVVFSFSCLPSLIDVLAALPIHAHVDAIDGSISLHHLLLFLLSMMCAWIYLR